MFPLSPAEQKLLMGLPEESREKVADQLRDVHETIQEEMELMPDVLEQLLEKHSSEFHQLDAPLVTARAHSKQGSMSVVVWRIHPLLTKHVHEMIDKMTALINEAVAEASGDEDSGSMGIHDKSEDNDPIVARKKSRGSEPSAN